MRLAVLPASLTDALIDENETGKKCYSSRILGWSVTGVAECETLSCVFFARQLNMGAT